MSWQTRVLRAGAIAMALLCVLLLTSSSMAARSFLYCHGMQRAMNSCCCHGPERSDVAQYGCASDRVERHCCEQQRAEHAPVQRAPIPELAAPVFVGVLPRTAAAKPRLHTPRLTTRIHRVTSRGPRAPPRRGKHRALLGVMRC